MSGRTSLGPVTTAMRGASSCPLPSSAPMLVILAASTASALAIALASALFAPILPIRVPSCRVTMKAPAQSRSVFTSTSACGWQRSIPSWHSVAPRRATGACLTIPAPGNAWAMAFRLSSPGACVTGRSDCANGSTALRWTRSHCVRPCRTLCNRRCRAGSIGAALPPLPLPLPLRTMQSAKLFQKLIFTSGRSWPDGYWTQAGKSVCWITTRRSIA